MRAEQRRRAITAVVDDAGSTMPVPMVSRHWRRKDHEGDEVEERRPEHRRPRRQHARGDDRRHRVGRVVKAVDEVEDQRQDDQQPDTAGRLPRGSARIVEAFEKCMDQRSLDDDSPR